MKIFLGEGDKEFRVIREIKEFKEFKGFRELVGYL